MQKLDFRLQAGGRSFAISDARQERHAFLSAKQAALAENWKHPPAVGNRRFGPTTELTVGRYTASDERMAVRLEIIGHAGAPSDLAVKPKSEDLNSKANLGGIRRRQRLLEGNSSSKRRQPKRRLSGSTIHLQRWEKSAQHFASLHDRTARFGK